MVNLTARGLKPAAVLAVDRPHGDRLKYIGGCRCDQCKAANSTYERERLQARKNGQWNGLVPADRARQHMLNLAEKGVGRRAVGAASDVADSILVGIRSGEKKQIRAETERKILAVTIEAASDRALIPAKPTWVLINKMLKWGHTKAELAKRLGYESPALQINKKTVTVRNAFEVRQLYSKLYNERKQQLDAARLADKLMSEPDRVHNLDGQPVVVRRKGKVDLQQPESVWAAWGGYR
jgi:hypothetical protein